MIIVGKTFISLVLTFLLGPGIGHLYIGKVKRGAAIFGLTLLAGTLFFLEAIRMSSKPLTPGQNPMIFAALARPAADGYAISG